MITFELINSLNDALTVRSIRNACREFMTRDTDKIGIFQQLKWWRAYKNQNSQQCCLLRDDRKPIGYGLIRAVDDKCWLSGGLIPEVRGKGLGKQLFQFLINQSQSSMLFLEVRKLNTTAYKLYQKLGFKKVSEEDGIVVMKWRTSWKK